MQITRSPQYGAVRHLAARHRGTAASVWDLMLPSRARSTVLRSLRISVCALSHARHSSSAPVTSGATSVYPDAPSPLQVANG